MAKEQKIQFKCQRNLCFCWPRNCHILHVYVQNKVIQETCLSENILSCFFLVQLEIFPFILTCKNLASTILMALSSIHYRLCLPVGLLFLKIWGKSSWEMKIKLPRPDHQSCLWFKCKILTKRRQFKSQQTQNLAKLANEDFTPTNSITPPVCGASF